MPDLKVNLSYGNEFIQDSENPALELMFIFWGIIIPIISIIGFIGNILTIVVLFRREMKSTTVYFLRTLVVTDTGIIIGAILGLSVISITQRHPNLWRFTDVIYPYIYTPTNFYVMTLQMINVWVTVAVSVERYIAICHPFKSVKLCNKRNAYVVIGIITATAILYNIPRFFATSSLSCGDPDYPSCRTLISTDFGKAYFYEKVYMIWLYMLLIYIIPLVLLGVLNTLLIVELMRMRRRRSVSNSQENSEANMSIVLILIVIVFIFCQTPGLVAQFVFLDPLVLLKWTCVSNTLFVLNSSVNFLIYTAVGRKFRRILLKTFQVLIKGPVTELRTSYSQNGGTELTRLQGGNNDSDEMDETCNLKGCGR
ncbi:obsolete signal transducer [Mactra antiquata]